MQTISEDSATFHISNDSNEVRICLENFIDHILWIFKINFHVRNLKMQMKQEKEYETQIVPLEGFS